MTVTKVSYKLLESSGFNGYPYGLVDVSKRYFLGTEDETKERVKIGDTFAFTKGDSATLVSDNRYQMYMDIASLFVQNAPGKNRENKFNDIIEIGSTLYGATSDGVAISKDDGKTWIWRKTMLDLDVQGFFVKDTQIWFYTKRTLGYSTDGFTTINYVAYNPLFDIRSIVVDDYLTFPRIILCTSNGVYKCTYDGSIWSAWSVVSPDPVITTDNTSNSIIGSVTLVSYPETYKYYDETKPYNKDFKVVVKLGSTFYFATSVGLIYTQDFVTWTHREMSTPGALKVLVAVDPTDINVTNIAVSAPDPTLPANANYTRLRVLESGKAYAIANNGSVVLISDAATPSFTNQTAATGFKDAVKKGFYCAAIDAAGAINISFDQFVTSVIQGSWGQFTDINKLFLTSTGRLLAYSDSGISISQEKETLITIDAIRRTIDTEFKGVYHKVSIYDLVSAIVLGGDNYNKFFFVDGKMAAYVFMAALDQTPMKWRLYGNQPPVEGAAEASAELLA